MYNLLSIHALNVLSSYTQLALFLRSFLLCRGPLRVNLQTLQMKYHFFNFHVSLLFSENSFYCLYYTMAYWYYIICGLLNKYLF